MIKCLFFAQLADDAQRDTVEVPYRDAMTARDLLSDLELTLPTALVDGLRLDAVMVSINQVLATWDDSLSDGDEVAFLPPFSGG